MKDENQHRYVQFPLYLLRDMHKDIKSTIRDILVFGAFKLAGELSPNSDVDIGDGLEYLLLDKDKERDKGWQTRAIELHSEFDSYKTLKNKRYPMPNVKVDLLREFNIKSKTFKEVDQFLAYISVQSILGIKQTTKTNNNHVMARMLGYASWGEIEVVGIDGLPQHLKDMIKRYSSPKGEISKARMKTLFNKLELRWRVLKMSDSNRGFYVAMSDKVSISQMASKINKDKDSYKLKQLDRLKKEALKEFR